MKHMKFTFLMHEKSHNVSLFYSDKLLLVKTIQIHVILKNRNLTYAYIQRNEPRATRTVNHSAIKTESINQMWKYERVYIAYVHG